MIGDLSGASECEAEPHAQGSKPDTHEYVQICAFADQKSKQRKMTHSRSKAITHK
jgi:hypothetical protein